MLTAGLKHELTITVEDKLTAAAVGSGALPVFSTPSMIALMEMCARDAVQPHLDEGWGSVGTLVEVRHLSATPVGLTVRCECELLEVKGKRLLFSVRAYDPHGLIGEGQHERYLVDNEKFMARATEKLNKPV
ncbi:MAG TPA: thioesterase family protein [Clostridiales bacterium]|jgi:fluoroacetyl-CoA thioesterase|nr:thioesterase family protein [Clostridiales bacterium]